MVDSPHQHLMDLQVVVIRRTCHKIYYVELLLAEVERPDMTVGKFCAGLGKHAQRGSGKPNDRPEEFTLMCITQSFTFSVCVPEKP